MFLGQMLGLPAPLRPGHFAVVPVGERLSLDYIQTDGGIASQHYAFLVDADEFDQIFERVAKHGLTYWARSVPQQPNAINHWDDGRGV